MRFSCSQEDAGRVIVPKGRTIKAIRTGSICSQRVGTSVDVEVVGNFVNTGEQLLKLLKRMVKKRRL